MKISYLVGLGTLIVSLCIPQKLGMLFYSRADLGTMIKAAGICSFISYASSASFGILNALGKQNVNLKNSIIVSCEGLILVFILTSIPSLNIYGYGIAIILTSITGLFMNLFEIRKTCEIRFSFKKAFVYTMFGLMGYLSMIIICKLIPDGLLVFDVLISTGICFLVIFYLSKFYNRFNIH